MGRQIIKQPNGKYALWSTVVNNFIYINCNSKDIIDIYIKEYTKEITEKVNGIIDKLEKGKKPYYQFTMTFEDAINSIERNHGEKECIKLKKEMI